MKPNAIVINELDNVAICMTDVRQGETVTLPDGREITALTDIGYSHKILLQDLRAGDDIIKYGEVIAAMSCDAVKGEFIHTHNLNLEKE